MLKYFIFAIIMLYGVGSQAQLMAKPNNWSWVQYHNYIYGQCEDKNVDITILDDGSIRFNKKNRYRKYEIYYTDLKGFYWQPLFKRNTVTSKSQMDLPNLKFAVCDQGYYPIDYSGKPWSHDSIKYICKRR